MPYEPGQTSLDLYLRETLGTFDTNVTPTMLTDLSSRPAFDVASRGPNAPVALNTTFQLHI